MNIISLQTENDNIRTMLSHTKRNLSIFHIWNVRNGHGIFHHWHISTILEPWSKHIATMQAIPIEIFFPLLSSIDASDECARNIGCLVDISNINNNLSQINENKIVIAISIESLTKAVDIFVWTIEPFFAYDQNRRYGKRFVIVEILSVEIIKLAIWCLVL